MTLHFHWLHAPRWLAQAHFNRAMTLMLGVIGISLVFGALRVLDVALSGALNSNGSHVAAIATAASGAPFSPEQLTGSEPTGADVPVDASLVTVPDATVEAIRL